MKRLLSSLLALSFAVSLAHAGVLKYNPEEFKDTGAMVKKVVGSKLKAVKKQNIKKLAIVECWGEFMVSKEKADAFGNFAWQGGSSCTTNVTLGNDYYESVANAAYEMAKKVFNDNGIEVLDKDVLIKNQDYIDLGLASETEGGGYKKGGMTSSSSNTKTVKRSTSGMGMIDGVFTGLMKVAKLKKIIPKIARDNGCDGVLKINFFVDSEKKGAPILSSFNIGMDCNIGEANAGKGKVDYYFKDTQIGLFSMTTPIGSVAEIVTDKAGTMDMTKYNDELMGILSATSGLYSQSLKDFLAEK